MAVGIPRTLYLLKSNPTFRVHFLYFPAAALTLVATITVAVAAVGWIYPGYIFYGLFLGWMAGDISYFSLKWFGADGIQSWLPGGGVMRNGSRVQLDTDTETQFTYCLGSATVALVSIVLLPMIWS